MSTVEIQAAAAPSGRPNLEQVGRRVRRRRLADPAFRSLATAAGVVLAALMLAMFVVLVIQSWAAIRRFGVAFLLSTTWNTVTGHYGALSALYGTVMTTLIAMVVAVPLALVIALLLVELAPPSLGRVIGTGIELLAAVPSIVYGMWGLFVVVPVMQNSVEPWIQGTWLGHLGLFQGPPIGIGFFSAGLVLALMVLPFIATVSRDVLRMVPRVVKEAGYGMGSTTWEVTRRISLRYGLAGIVGAIFIGLGRALGETMAVAFIIGQTYKIQPSLFGTGNTIASTLANTFAEATDTLQRSALIELGLVLFLVTAFFQLMAHLWLRRARKTVGGRA